MFLLTKGQLVAGNTKAWIGTDTIKEVSFSEHNHEQYVTEEKVKDIVSSEVTGLGGFKVVKIGDYIISGTTTKTDIGQSILKVNTDIDISSTLGLIIKLNFRTYKIDINRGSNETGRVATAGLFIENGTENAIHVNSAIIFTVYSANNTDEPLVLSNFSRSCFMSIQQYAANFSYGSSYNEYLSPIFIFNTTTSNGQMSQYIEDASFPVNGTNRTNINQNIRELNFFIGGGNLDPYNNKSNFKSITVDADMSLYNVYI